MGLKKLMKKVLLPSSMVISMMMLTACSSTGDDGKVSLRYSTWDNTHTKAIETLIEGFEKENPNIDIQLEVISNGDYWTKMETAAAGGSAPDVFWVDARRFGTYAKEGMLVGMDDYIKENKIDMSQYLESITSIYNFDGKQYAMPSFWDDTVLLLNTKMMEEYGIEKPKKDWNWEEMIAWLEDAKAKLPKDIYPFASNTLEYTQLGIFNGIALAGGQVLNEDKTKALIDTPESVNGYKTYLDLVKSDLHSPFDVTLETGAGTLFKSEKALAYQAGSYSLLTYSDKEQAQVAGNFEIYPIPEIKEDVKTKSVIHGVGNVISANSKHPDEAFKFINYMSSEESMKTYTELALVSQSHKNVQNLYGDVMKDKTGLDVSVVYDVAKDAMPLPNSVDTAKWDKVIVDNISSYVQEKQSFDDMIKNTQKGVQEVLDKENQNK
ncbi:MAG: ABC transporter substrate-binding protein [Paraclostridium sp.]|uniref:ABC transporter substrate-binding protein n=1 Tax=Paraclostridium sp. TaxID=2023273 RepID=UPI003F2A6713